MSKRTCQICQNIIPAADSGRYCYLHRQVYDSLVSEYDAVKKTSKGSSLDWKKFLAEKMSSVRYLPKELGDVIKMELEST
jgi:predicted RNA-binding protein with EMAP domain